MIQKNYSIPIHRKIGSTELIKTDIKESHFNIEVKTYEKEIEVNENFESIIYNIDKKEDTLIIYSNTLNIKVTDKFYKNIPLYDMLETNIRDFEYILKTIGEEYYLEKNNDDVVIYFNNKNNIFISDYYKIYNIGNPLTRTNNIKVRKLKNRFKITVTGINTKLVSILLGSRYLFSPTIYKDFIEFHDMLVNIGTTQYYIYNHSFNILNKKELITDSGTVKDPVIEYISLTAINDYPFCTYNSWRSNLLFDQKLNSELYYYLNTNSTNKTDLIIQSFSKLDTNEGLVFMFSSSIPKISYSVTKNPYLRTEVSTPLGENYSIVFDNVKDYKYNKYNDIKFGTEKIVLDLEKSVVNRQRYLSNYFEDMYQEDKITNYTTETTKSVEDLPQIFRTNLNELNYVLEEIKNRQTFYRDNKTYN